MKANRQKKIMELIKNNIIETQEELVRALNEDGYNVTQATVSRDIKELGLVKISLDEQRSRYAAPQAYNRRNVSNRLKRLFQDSVVGINDSENLILIKTLPGTANAVASCIDNLDAQEIIGTVAGDDTILVIAKPKKAVPMIIRRFEEMME